MEFELVNVPRGVSVGYGDGGIPRTAAGDPKVVLFNLLGDPEDGVDPTWALGMNT